MRKMLAWACVLLLCSGCQADDIVVRYEGSTARVENLSATDSVKVFIDGARVNIKSAYTTHPLSLRLTGESDDGQLVLRSAGKTIVKLNGLNLKSQEGAPLDLKNKKRVAVVAAEGTENTLVITACNDTANHKAAALWAKDKLTLSGTGILNIIAIGDGCRGIKTKKDITIEKLTLNVTTSGNNLGEKAADMGGFPGLPEGGFPDMPEGGFPDMPEGGFPDMPEGGFPGMPEGGFPGMPEGGFPDMPEGERPDFGGMRPDFDSVRPDSIGGFGPMGGGFGGKHKYVSSTKGIASKGKIIVNSGCVTVRTATAGAEGIEGKEGVVLNGGIVDVISPDDAINANAPIEFNGAHVIAYSTGNDAIDANPGGSAIPPFGGGSGQVMEPAVIITGGTVYAWSQMGPPEEGIDSDFAPIAISGGKVFTVGGSMGGTPSVPTDDTAKQPTVLLSGIDILKDEPILIYNAKDSLVDTITIPFSLRSSSSLISSPDFNIGETYTLKTKNCEKTFTLSNNITLVRWH